jgi:hypothetical protein
MEELRKEAEKLAEERKLAREQALEWTREVRMESDEEKERKPKKARKQKADGSGDEAEPKKKRRGKLRRGGDAEDGAEEPAVFSDDEDVERPKKVCRSRIFGGTRGSLCYFFSGRRRSVSFATTTTRKWWDRGKSSCAYLTRIFVMFVLTSHQQE